MPEWFKIYLETLTVEQSQELVDWIDKNPMSAEDIQNILMYLHIEVKSDNWPF